MKERLEKISSLLQDSIEKNGLNSPKTQKLCEKFNKIMNECIKNEKQYSENNIMKITYEKSIEEIKETTKIFTKFSTVKEWNKYAKEKYLLNSESIKYISGLNWHQLRIRILSEID